MIDIRNQKINMFPSFLRFLPLLLWAFLLTACSADEPESSSTSLPVVTVLYGIDGLGDRSYNDQIAQGVYRAQAGGLFRLQTFAPESMAEAEQMLNYWLEKYQQSTAQQLLIIASDDYDSLATAYRPQLPDDSHARVLLFERSQPLEPTYTFHLPFYGAAYEAGMLAGVLSRDRNEGARNAMVMMANGRNKRLIQASDAFEEGYHRYCDGAVSREALDSNTRGYAAIDSAYAKVSRIGQDVAFLYPLVGGSIWGIIEYLNESASYEKTRFWIAGMDTDFSSYANLAAFSTVKHIDTIVQQYIASWLDNKSWERHQTFNLASGMIENAEVQEMIFFGVEDVDQQQIHQQALAKEQEYEKSHTY